MRVVVDGEKWGISFRHERGGPSGFADAVAVDILQRILGVEEVEDAASIRAEVAEVVQHYLDGLEVEQRRAFLGWRNNPHFFLPRSTQRKVTTISHCTIWEGQGRPFGAGADGNTIIRGEGKAECSSLDRFEAEKGRKMALERALESSGLGEAQRRQVWEQYHRRKVRRVA